MMKLKDKGRVVVLIGSDNAEDIGLEDISDTMGKISSLFPPKWKLSWYIKDEKEVKDFDEKLD